MSVLTQPLPRSNLRKLKSHATNEDGPLVRRSKIWILVAGSLIIALLIEFGPWFSGRSLPAAPPSNASNNVPAKLRTLVKPPVLPGPQSLPDGPRKVEICGFGKVELDPTDPMAASLYVGERTEKTAQKWLSTLMNNDDYRARAAGLFLEGKIGGVPRILPMTEQARDGLVQLAVGTADPAVYATALYACGAGFSDPGNAACRQISADGWARREPDNAVPWLLLAGQARDKHDVAAEAQAFSRAAKASMSDSYVYSMYTFAEPELPSDLTPVQLSYLAVEVIGIEAATGQTEFLAASKHCSTEAMRDSSVRQQCSSLAELWVTRGTTLLDFGIGISIGARAGWPAQKVNDLKMERDALMQLITERGPANNDDTWTCDAVQRVNAHVSRMARMGEMGAVRDELERSGETVRELAQKWADHMEKIRREVEQQHPAAPADNTSTSPPD
jgi:hypothetical protein